MTGDELLREVVHDLGEFQTRIRTYARSWCSETGRVTPEVGNHSGVT